LDRTCDRRVPVTERSEEPRLYRLDQRQLAVPEPIRDPAGDVLDVHVRDPATRVSRDGDRVHTTEDEMARVETEAGATSFEHARAVVTVLDERSPVRVDDVRQVKLLGDVVQAR